MSTHFSGTAEEILALDTFIKLAHASSTLETRIHAHGALGNLTLSQFGVLETIDDLGPLCQRALSQKLLKSTGDMTLVLDNLEKRGLVRRVRSVEDRRKVTVELTGAGRDLIGRVAPLQVAAIVAEMSALTPEEQAQLGRLLLKLGSGGGQPDRASQTLAAAPEKPGGA